jgi:hypothetical protein
VEVVAARSCQRRAAVNTMLDPITFGAASRVDRSTTRTAQASWSTGLIR